MSMPQYRDREGIVHYAGPGIAVNAGLCGNNDSYDDDTLAEVDCLACLAIVKYVKSNGRQQ